MAITLREILTFIFIKRTRGLLLERGQLLGLMWSTFGNYCGYFVEIVAVEHYSGLPGQGKMSGK